MKPKSLHTIATESGRVIEVVHPPEGGFAVKTWAGPKERTYKGCPIDNTLPLTIKRFRDQQEAEDYAKAAAKRADILHAEGFI